jgi:hypothetical protein
MKPIWRVLLLLAGSVAFAMQAATAARQPGQAQKCALTSTGLLMEGPSRSIATPNLDIYSRGIHSSAQLS